MAEWQKRLSQPRAGLVVIAAVSNSFCEAVMLAKEEAGRVREQTSSRPSRRERHSGRRGSRDDLRPPKVRVGGRRARVAHRPNRTRPVRAPKRAIRLPQMGPSRADA
ncbi:hypothetical protein SFRURICE_011863 [Spodoptera frugiperda]|nr:hypothetical protein SFRURICE_011863 [Spodoptera frugiperda]